ncbi:MAG: hypothetical protein HZC38_18115 [Chloroflexi bacterium]|nr:hypothetical protein [Chloroflexota bacterium]
MSGVAGGDSFPAIRAITHNAGITNRIGARAGDGNNKNGAAAANHTQCQRSIHTISERHTDIDFISQLRALPVK